MKLSSVKQEFHYGIKRHEERNGTYSLNIRMINISTGEITRTASSFYKGEIDGLLTKIIPEIAGEFTGTAPIKADPAPKLVVIKKAGISNKTLLISAGVGVLVVGGIITFLMLRKSDPTPAPQPVQR